VTASRGVTAVESVDPPSTATPADPITPAAPVVSTGSGGVVPGQSPTPFIAPLVTFGDGRTPAFVPGGPDELPGRVFAGIEIAQRLPAPSAAAPLAMRSLPPLASRSPRPLTMTAIPLPLSDTPVTSFWGRVQPGWPAGVLFGIAGLLLAPIGGVWLGHRQARATKAAAHLVSR
jgi:hypothetical protein